MPVLRVRYQTFEFGQVDIHVETLRDKQQFQDIDGVAENLGISSAAWPIFGVVWPSSIILAHYLLDYKHDNKRILEVGCGIGLVSLMLNYRLADITSTDYHPEAEAFLKRNALLNNGNAIPFIRTDWKDASDKLGRFDVIVGSDLLYEDEHVVLLSRFIERHSKTHCEVVIVDPGRGRNLRFSKKMAGLGYSCSQRRPENTDYLEKPFKGMISLYSR